MPVARDWTQTLWPASFKGFPFWFESDDDDFGRAIVEHEFPHSDVNYNEDMGAKARHFSGAAYLSGDNADAQAASFTAVLLSQGPGTLVVPIYGPVLVRALPCKRKSERDRLGRIAFEVHFVAEGSAVGLISVPALGVATVSAAASFASAIVAASPAMMAIADQPEYVAGACADELQMAAASIDAVRTSYPVDPTTSATVADQVQAIVTAAPLLLDPSGPAPSDVANLAAVIGSPAPSTPAATLSPADGVRTMARALVTTCATLASGLPAPIARDAMASLIDVYAPETAAAISAALSANAATAAANVTGAQQLLRLAALNAWATALVNVTYTDRPQGVTARAQAAERFEIELNHCPGARYHALYLAIEALQGSVVQFLTQLIVNLAPVLTIEARLQLPSLVWAWRLYQDPTRAVDLVLRNQVRHPSFMPTTFAALAPGYDAPGIPTAWPPPPL